MEVGHFSLTFNSSIKLVASNDIFDATFLLLLMQLLHLSSL
jgi:hypothetical protein